ncbi:MAG: hypothetical protein ACREU7_10185 [Burkholderiales bacterium]
MANHAYASLWCRDFSEANMLASFERLLGTVPSTAGKPTFIALTIRAVDHTETPVIDLDLRAQPHDAAQLIALAVDHLHFDCAYETAALCDFWTWENAENALQKRPQCVALACHGEEYDGAMFEFDGHFQIDLGFEHVFTGHAHLLGFGAVDPSAAPVQHPAEAEFVRRMASPQNLRDYQEKTRENVRMLLDWMARVQATLPLDRYKLWSEGEENFEARLDEILAVR